MQLITFSFFDDEPPLDEFAVELNLELRDKHRFLIARDKLIARFKRELGFDGDAAKKFSDDFYRQVTQLVFNGELRKQTFRDDNAANIHHDEDTP